MILLFRVVALVLFILAVIADFTSLGHYFALLAAGLAFWVASTLVTDGVAVARR